MYALKRIKFVLTRGLWVREAMAHLRHKIESPQAKRLPQVTAADIVGSDAPPHQLLEADAVDGNVSVQELEVIASITAHLQPARVFEIGTFDGRTTVNLAANAAAAEVFTLDLPQRDLYETQLRLKTGDRKFVDKRESGARFRSSPYASRITQLYGDSAAFDSGPLENSMDLVFVDGSHSYEYVKNDTELALRLLRNGKGIVLWHDYGWTEVVRALNEYYEHNPVFAGLVHIQGTSLACLHIE